MELIGRVTKFLLFLIGSRDDIGGGAAPPNPPVSFFFGGVFDLFGGRSIRGGSIISILGVSSFTRRS